MTATEDEADRILAEYERREREIGRDYYALTNAPNLFARQGQQRALLRGLTRANALPLHERKVLEIGCGRGQWFSLFEDFGGRRELLAGIDLDDGRVAEARARFASADIRVGDASELPWADQTFDIVFQSTVMTSILDTTVRKAIAAEMIRVLSRRGAVIWYDFRYDNPTNPNVRGVTEKEIKQLFPSSDIQLESVTLAPPIARLIVPQSWLLAAGLERLRIMNTHLLAVIRRK